MPGSAPSATSVAAPRCAAPPAAPRSCAIPVALKHWKAQPLARVEVALRNGARQRPDAADIAGALGDADRAARIEQVERVAGLQHRLVCGQREPRMDQARRFAFEKLELPEQDLRVGLLEVIGGLLDLVLVEHVAVAERALPPVSVPARVREVEHVVHAL